MSNKCSHYFVVNAKAQDSDYFYIHEDGDYGVYLHDNMYDYQHAFTILSSIGDKISYAITALAMSSYTTENSQKKLLSLIETMLCDYNNEIKSITWHFWNHRNTYGRMSLTNAKKFEKFLNTIDSDFNCALYKFLFDPIYNVIINDNRNTLDRIKSLGILNEKVVIN